MSRLLPELSEDAALSRDEVAMLFNRDDLDEGMRTFSAAAKEIPFSMRTDPESGEAEYRLGDVENVVLDWRGERRATNRRCKPRTDNIAPPEVRAGGKIIFADEDTPDAILLSDEGGKGEGVKAITVANAAEQAGLSEEDLSARLVGRARLKVVDGDLVVPLADLRSLAEGGEIPEPSERSEQTPETKPVAQAGIHRATATDRPSRRLGAPRRWSQR